MARSATARSSVPNIRTAATAAAIGLAGLATACAPNPAPETAMAEGRQCFHADRITGFRAVSDRIVNVSAGANEVYQFELFGTCPEVDWANQIAVVSRGSSWICSGLDATIIAPSSTGPQRCAVRSVTRLTPAQLAVLPADQRP